MKKIIASAAVLCLVCLCTAPSPAQALQAIVSPEVHYHDIKITADATADNPKTEAFEFVNSLIYDFTEFHIFHFKTIGTGTVNVTISQTALFGGQAYFLTGFIGQTKIPNYTALIQYLIYFLSGSGDEPTLSDTDLANLEALAFGLAGIPGGIFQGEVGQNPRLTASTGYLMVFTLRAAFVTNLFNILKISDILPVTPTDNYPVTMTMEAYLSQTTTTTTTTIEPVSSTTTTASDTLTTTTTISGNLTTTTTG